MNSRLRLICTCDNVRHPRSGIKGSGLPLCRLCCNRIATSATGGAVFWLRPRSPPGCLLREFLPDASVRPRSGSVQMESEWGFDCATVDLFTEDCPEQIAQEIYAMARHANSSTLKAASE